MDAEELIRIGFKEIGFELSQRQLEMFITYKDLLLKWNEKINLTAITDEKEIITKHFLDSVSCAKTIPVNKNVAAIDVGTGAGFPGIPISILFPELKFTLLDSLNKRINFLKEVIEQLGLTKVTAVQGRAEEFGKDLKYREKYDYAFSRAVGTLPILSEYCIPFIKVGGVFFAYKGNNVSEELDSSKEAIKTLGCEISGATSTNIPFSDIKHTLITITKLQNTPTIYPRRQNKIVKSPIK